jgi:hypothetical protein
MHLFCLLWWLGAANIPLTNHGSNSTTDSVFHTGSSAHRARKRHDSTSNSDGRDALRRITRDTRATSNLDRRCEPERRGLQQTTLRRVSIRRLPIRRGILIALRLTIL